jgi:ribosomal protein L29
LYTENIKEKKEKEFEEKINNLRKEIVPDNVNLNILEVENTNIE